MSAFQFWFFMAVLVTVTARDEVRAFSGRAALVFLFMVFSFAGALYDHEKEKHAQVVYVANFAELVAALTHN